MRRLDVMVAEKVMGWKLADEWAITLEEIAQSELSNVADAGSQIYTNGVRVDEFCPSTGIAAVWRAAEKLWEKHGCSVSVTILQRNIQTGAKYEADVTGGDLSYRSPRLWVSARGDLPAFALCLAILRAKGIPEAEIQEALNCES